MKAIRINQYGSPEVMSYIDAEEPEIAIDEIKIKVKAAGVNPVDCKIREGSSFLAKKLEKSLPIGLGFDLSGIIVELGSKITGFKIGDSVLGTTISIDRPGSYAEYAIVGSNTIVTKPNNLEFEVAAALPTPGPTAWKAVNKYGNISKNDRVLIHAGAGGVGHLAVQFAKQLGAYVFSTAHPKDHEFLKGLGVDELIDFTTTDFKEVVRGLDTVIDLVGGKTGMNSIEVLKSRGTLVTVPTYSQEEILEAAAIKNIKAVGFVVYDDMQALEEVVKSVADGRVQVNLSEPMALADAAQAHQKIQSGTATGKIVLRI